MDNRVSNQIKDFIEKNNKIGIAVGKNPGVDEMGAALSLYLSLQSFGKDVAIVCPTEALVEHSRLVGIDKVKSSFDAGSGDLTASFPYKEGEIEKISYTLENGFLNIIVKAGEDGLNFSENDVVFKRSQSYPGLLFVIGTPRLSDLGGIFNPQALKDTIVINIDNKSDNQGFGDIAFVSPTNSSICEQIGDLILSLDFPLDVDIAQNLLIGIEDATENFQNNSTSPLAFEMVGNLMKKGAIRSDNKSSKIMNQDLDMDIEEAPVFAQPALQRRPAQSQPFKSFANYPKQSQQVRSFLDQQIKNQQKQNKEDRGRKASISTQNIQEDDQDKNPPTDWLAPKIYKGSTNI